MNMLTVLTLIPLAGGVVLLVFCQKQNHLGRYVGLGASLLALLLALGILAGFDSADGGFQRVERHSWAPAIGAEYHLGVDGLGLLMVMLTALLIPLALLTSWKIRNQASLYFALVLFLQSGLFGAFTALNFFHWFLFWELSLIPAFFLIKYWGGPGRNTAATQFFIFTMVGSIGLLLAFVALAMASGTFDFQELAALGSGGMLAPILSETVHWSGVSGDTVAMIIFLAAFLGFAVKTPLMPFHSWLPSTYVEAPTGTTMLLTGAMSKMGVYGFVRLLLPIFPDQMQRVLPVLLVLAVLTIVLSAFAALAQKDLKRMLAYSSINHLGYCLLGIFAAALLTSPDLGWETEKAAALNGAILQMFNHGVTAALLFAFVGFLEQRSGGLRGLNDFGGLRAAAPVFCGLMGITVFSSLGLPGLNNFAGEFLIFKGAFSLAPWAAAFAVIGLLVTAVFLLTLMQQVFHGPLNQRWAAMADLSWGERALVAPFILLMFAIGIYPQLIIGLINNTVLRLVEGLAR
jgi:NADH-quinone oxidoreductase subunit M